MIEYLKDILFIKKIRKTKIYSRFRQYLPMPEPKHTDDSNLVNNAEIIKLDWPIGLQKPFIGIVKDFDKYPKWTKYCRFLDNNGFQYGFYNIHSNDWIEKAKKFDIIIGFFSPSIFDLNEIRDKYYFLETYLYKTCYPSFKHAILYENKRLEIYLLSLLNFPFAKTFISHDKSESLQYINKAKYPMVSKIDPSSGSSGVDLINDKKKCKKIVEQAFSNIGRKTHKVYFRQVNYVYFQDYIPNDGYDIRIIVIGNQAFGYYRKVLTGDFRASGMNLVEKRDLPSKSVRIAWQLNKSIKSPMLVVDMLRGLDGNFYIIEISPICQIESPEQLHVNEVPGFYKIETDATIEFRPGKIWVHELALKEFLLNDYLPMLQ